MRRLMEVGWQLLVAAGFFVALPTIFLWLLYVMIRGLFSARYNVRNRCICGHGKAIHAWFRGRCYSCDCDQYQEDR